MSKQKKKKEPSPRTIRRQEKNPHVRKRVLKGVRDVIDKASKDRATYFKKFIAGWRASANAANWLSKQLLSSSVPCLNDDVCECLLYPYELLMMIYFARLMDHMEDAEEAVFTDEVDKVDAAWQEFLAILRARVPELKKEIDTIETSRHAIHDEVVGVFRGDYPPAIRPQWGRPHETLKNAFDALKREVAK